MKKNNKIYYIILIMFIIVVIILVTIVIKWLIDNYNTKKITEEIYNTIQNTQDTNVVADDSQVIESIQIETKEVQKETDYTKYYDMKLSDINFEQLLKINPDTVGWIKLNGTNINYPVVHAKDNVYYLTKSFNKKNNNAGWVFLDYRNSINDLSKNTIIYAHSRLDGTMFGTLHRLSKYSFFELKENNYINLVTENKDMLWQIFSVYKTTAVDPYCKVKFSTEADYETYIKNIINKSYHQFNITVSKTDYILTLSTCGNNNTRLVINAKLVNDK